MTKKELIRQTCKQMKRFADENGMTIVGVVVFKSKEEDSDVYIEQFGNLKERGCSEN